MGAFSTIIGFGAGYLLGANRQAPPVQRVQNQVRGAVTKRFGFGSREGVTDIRQVRDVMTPMPETVSPDTTLVEAAKRMADGDFGDVLVAQPGSETLMGIVTDRDIAIRAVATGRDAHTTTVGSILSRDLETVSPDDTLQVASSRMRAANVRRLPVVENGRPIGIVSLGDLSVATDTSGTLADISVAPPDR
jgi:CBS domain-containing protein